MNKIFPFLWLNGENNDIEREIKGIADAGLHAFCVESRVHFDFCGEGWWKDMSEVLRCAEKYGMQVWILDDKSYPTGLANGKLKDYPHLQKRHIAAYQRDVVSDGGVLQLRAGESAEDEFMAAWAIPNAADGLRLDEALEITSSYENGWLFPVLPAGTYRISVIVKTKRGSERKYFVDCFNPQSVQLLLDEVYERHYERFGEYFGKEIVGFFSDEPRFANGFTQRELANVNSYEASLGILGMAYPYSAEIVEETLRATGAKTADLLALWYPIEGYEEIRVAYMDACTRAYAKNFSGKIGAWCHSHGVCYAGHIIEDMNAHVNTGCSCGHYFRSQAGQDYAGVDVVLHQIKPYCTEIPTIAPICGGYADPDFFLHTLPMLAVSDGLLDPDKKGALCENFGAYGWTESGKDSKWLADVMLSRGVQYFIPHAFSTWSDNDDCPPHFFEGGRNPEYEGFRRLMEYVQDVNANVRADERRLVGVLYHAETAWTGRRCEPVDPIVKRLFELQIPCLIVPSDRIVASGIELLIVPKADYYPQIVRSRLKEAEKAGVKIVYGCEEAVSFAKAYRGSCYLEEEDAGIRLLHGEQPLVFRESGEGECVLRMPEGGEYTLYDPMNGVKESVENRIPLRLAVGETRIVLREKTPKIRYGAEKTLAEKFEVKAIMENGNRSLPVDGVGALNRLLPDFSGYVSYGCKVETSKEGEYEIRFSDYGGTLVLWIDGEKIGVRLGNPARFRVELSVGTHELTFTLNNTLANERRDDFSKYDSIKAFGLLALPTICPIEKE